MRRALMWLNLYGDEAARHKLKKGVKMHTIFWINLKCTAHMSFHHVRLQHFCIVMEPLARHAFLVKGSQQM